MSRVTGINELARKLAAFGTAGENMVRDEIEGAGRDIEVQAKSLAPVDLGILRGSINYEPTNNGLGAKISANAPYAAYQEFGTGGLVNVPPEMKELATYYRGKGVRQVNLKPQPFLYPAFVDNRKKLIEQLKKGLIRLTR